MAAQQPLLPTLEPSSHVAAEAPAAKTKTITNAASLRPKAIGVRGISIIENVPFQVGGHYWVLSSGHVSLHVPRAVSLAC